MIGEPSPTNNYHAWHVKRLLESLAHLTGRKPFPELGEVAQAKAAWEAPFALVSHGTEIDPIFNYGNRKALELFEMDWKSFTKLPSRLSAEAVNRTEREALLAKVNRDGFIDDYSGIRISATGKRFRIENAVVWNVFDEQGRPYGQAALFYGWKVL